jgi:hypothetical protein
MFEKTLLMNYELELKYSAFSLFLSLKLLPGEGLD